MRPGLLCLALTTAACGDHNVDLGTPRSDDDGGADAQAGCDDLDGDGYGDGCATGADCDDLDETRHPGARETCNEIDDDCDGATDEGVRTACGDCDAFCFTATYGDGEPIADPGAEVNDIGLDDNGDLSLIPGGASTGQYAVVVAGCPKSTTWFRVEWAATVPSGAALSLTLRSGDDTATLDTQPALGPYDTSPIDLATVGSSIYLKLTFDFAASPGGESPVLHDFRAVWECPDVE